MLRRLAIAGHAQTAEQPALYLRLKQLNEIDWANYPGIEDYDPAVFDSIRAIVQISFKTFGYSWSHPRVIAFVQRVEERVGRPIPTSHHLPYVAYRALATYLAAELMDPSKAAIDDYQRQRGLVMLGGIADQLALPQPAATSADLPSQMLR